MKHIKIYSIYLFFTLFPLYWLQGDFIINPGDMVFPINPENDLYRMLYRWDGSRGLGVPQDRNSPQILYYALVNIIFQLTSSIKYVQIIIIMLLNLLCVHFFKKLIFSNLVDDTIVNTKDNLRILLFLIVASIYLYNPFIYSYRYNHSFINSLLIYYMLPAILYALVNIFSWRSNCDIQNKSIFKLIGLNILMIPAMENPAYMIAVIICFLPLVFVYETSPILSFKKYKKLIIFIVILNLWYIVRPLTFISSSNIMLNELGVNIDVLKLSEYSSASVLNILKLTPWGTLGDGYNFQYGHIFYDNYFSFLILSSTFIIVAYALIAKNLKVYFYLFLLVFYIFIIKSSNGPFSDFFILSQEIGVFKIFRFTIDKFYPQYILIFVLLLFKSYEYFVTNYKYPQIFFALIIPLAFFSGYPFYIGNVFNDDPVKYAKHVYNLDNRIMNISKLLSSNGLDGRGLVLPDNNYSSSGSWISEKNNSIGFDPFWNFSPNLGLVILNRFGNSYGVNKNSINFLMEMNDAYLNNEFERLINILVENNFKYIILNKKIDHNESLWRALNFIKNTSNSLENFESNDYYNIYKIKSSTVVNYTFLNPVRYRVNKTDSSELYFHQSYDENWRIYSVSDVNSFFPSFFGKEVCKKHLGLHYNYFKDCKLSLEGTYIIYYKFQDIFYMGCILSFIFFLVFVLIIFGFGASKISSSSTCKHGRN